MRGRKRGIAIQCDSPAVEIYPREGTETSQVCPTNAYGFVEIYPREGTKTLVWAWVPLTVIVEIYPREGTETHRGQKRFA